VRALLDTHVWLWMALQPDRLTDGVRSWLVDPEHELLLSAGSVWEMALKEATGKLRLPEPLEHYVPKRSSAMGIRFLPITHRHAARGAALPRRHRDPFDRLLIAQAQMEGLSVVTADRAFTLYDVEIVTAG
jgi:PIN domain nuclease of toxin-antitoxin system